MPPAIKRNNKHNHLHQDDASKKKSNPRLTAEPRQNQKAATDSNKQAKRDQQKTKEQQPLKAENSPSSGSQSNDERPILRVNLIKKSSRPTNFQLNLAERRQNRSKSNLISHDPSPKTTNPKTVVDVTHQSVKSPQIRSQLASQHDDISKNTSTKENTPSHSSDISSISETSKSRELVVSLIKDIGHSSSKKDFDQMLREIHLAINEIQESQKETSATNFSIQNRGLVQNANKSKEKSVSNSCGSIASPLPLRKMPKKQNIEHPKETKLKVKNLRENTSSAAIKQLSRDEENSKYLIQALLSSDDETIVADPQTRRSPNDGSRMPQRCLRVTSSHDKYISPHRKRSLEERLNRAREARERFLEDRANKFREILKKIDGMKAWKEEDTLNLKAYVGNKLQKAADKRREQLDKIVRKAHDEDSKVSEIQFINNLEAQNKRHDMNSRKREFEARLQDLQDERQRRFEEKQAKEAAAEIRRKSLEAERRAKVLEIQQRRRLKNQKVEQQKQVREKKRLEKNRDLEQKISAIKEAYTHSVQSLKNRIDLKQEQSERRHEINLKLIRQKAFELSIKRYNSYNHPGLSASSCSDLSLTDGSKQSASNNSNIGNGGTKPRLQLKPFTTKKFCTLCKETIGSETALFSHLRGDTHLGSINQFYKDSILTTNEAVEIQNLKHIVDTDEPLGDESAIGKGQSLSSDQQSSRSSSLVNYYHSSYLNQVNGGLIMSEADRVCLLAIEKKCRKLRHKLIVAGKKFNREWFSAKIRARLAQLIIQQRLMRQQTTNTEATSIANTIDLSANNANCQQNKPFYLKISRITRELISLTTDQRISGGGLMPANIVHSADRLLADLNKQLVNRKTPQLSEGLLKLAFVSDRIADNTKKPKANPKPSLLSGLEPNSSDTSELKIADSLAMLNKMIEFYATDTLYLYDIIACFVSILRRIVPDVSLASRLPSTVTNQSHYYSTLIDPISLNSYHCHRTPILPARIYLKIITTLQMLCSNNSDLCYLLFQSNHLIYLSDILSYRLGFIIGNESPASSISGSSSAATLSAAAAGVTVSSPGDRKTANCSSSLNSIKRQSSSLNSSKLRQNGAGKTSSRAQDNAARFDGGSDGEDSDLKEHEVDDEDEELWQDNQAETYKRTEEVVDDMTAGICKLLAIITETILNRPLVMLTQVDKIAFDQRSQDFISYMVSVGIVDTESVIMSHIHHQQRVAAAAASSFATTNSTTSSASTTTTSAASTSGSISATSQSNSANLNSAHQLADQLEGSHSIQNSSYTATSQLGAGGVRKGQHWGQHQHNQPALATPTQQANSGFSLGCSTGSISSNQTHLATSNKITNFTTSCIQFVTSLLKLVTTKLPGFAQSANSVDSLKLRSVNNLEQQDKTQLLTTLKMSQFSGVLTLLYDMLVHSPSYFRSPFGAGGQQVQQSNATSKQPADQPLELLKLALCSLRLANYVAYIDLDLFQATLASDEMLPIQLRHVCSQLISLLVQSSDFKPLDWSPNECELYDYEHEFGQQQHQHQGQPAKVPGSGYQAYCSSLKNSLLNEIVLIMGNFSHLHPTNQLWLNSGQRPTIVEQLVNLPFDYFSKNKLKLVLMPTLICFSYSNDQICQLIKQDLSLSMMTSFIKERTLESQVEASRRQQVESSDSDGSKSLLGHELLIGQKLGGNSSGVLQNQSGSVQASTLRASRAYNLFELGNRRHKVKLVHSRGDKIDLASSI